MQPGAHLGFRHRICQTAAMPSWILLSIVSAILLGFYDAAKKHSVDRNAVPAVLLAAVTCGGLIWGTALIATRLVDLPLDVPPMTLAQHAMVFLKSVIVATSWTLAYFAIKHLPLSISAPLRATGPVWTIALACLVIGERPSSLQWAGIVVVIAAFFRFATIGRWEGIVFTRSAPVAWMIIGTVVGAMSGLWDKHLLQNVGLSPVQVQAWFTIDLVITMIPGWLYWYIRDRHETPFVWRWSIAAIAVLLLMADYAYFVALSDPAALVSVVSPVRRLAVLVALAFGIAQLKEKHPLAKSLCVVVVLVGITLISIGSSPTNE